MIVVHNITKYFGALKAVDDLSFNVAEGENLILLGTSGCGKTTTLKMINRLIEPSAGTITVARKNIFAQPAEILRRSIGYVLQDNGLFPHYSVQQNIAVVPQLLGWDKKRIENRTLELMGKLHLPEELLRAYPEQLSGGQQQRVGLARALMADPPVLLMDEPFGALDPLTRYKIRQEFKELDELKRKTIIMVTHDVQEAFELGDRICLMDKGKIVQNAGPAALINNPASAFVSGFLKEHQLQLELKAVKLTDLWDLIENGTAENQAIPVNGGLNVWEAIEMLSNRKDIALLATNHLINGTKYIAFGTLINAFHRYQNTPPA